MHLKQIPFIWIALFFCAGIILSDFFPLDYLTLFSVLVFGFVVLQVLERSAKSATYPKYSSYFMLLLVGLFGFCRYAFVLPENNPHGFENKYLEGDKLVVSIQSLSPTQGEYIKSECEVKELIRYRDTLSVSGKVVLFLKDPQKHLKEFDVCLINTSLMKVKNKLNPGEFDSELFWKHKGIHYLGFVNQENYVHVGKVDPPWTHIFTVWRNHFSSLLEHYLTGDEMGVAKALILGDRSSLDSEITGKFGNTGAMHVLAVSGLHVGILVQILMLVLGLFKKWISKNQSIVIALILIWIYSFMTGLSASVVRSAVMFSLLVGSDLLERDYNKFNVLAFSAVVILIWNPHFLYDIGFQLSYLAMVGIFLFYKPLSQVFVSRFKWIRLAIEGTMVGIAAQITTVPLTLYYFHQFPNYFILTNLGLMIFSFLILALGVALFSFSWIHFFAKIIAGILLFSLFVMLAIIDFIDGLPGAVSSGFVLNSLLVILLFGCILLFYYAFIREKFKLLQLSLVVVFSLIVLLVFKRYQGMSKNEICFFQADEPSFVVKLGTENFVFYGNKNRKTKKILFLAKAYQKINPGNIHVREISHQKKSSLRSESNRIEIERKKGGYSILVNDKQYFLATSLENEGEHEQMILASWLEEQHHPHQLKRSALQFDLD